MLAGLHVREGQPVSAGDLLCTLETTKSTHALHAEGEGFVAGLRAREGDTLRAGEVLCFLASSPDWTPPQPVPGEPSSGAFEAPEGLRITKPALSLAQERGLDLSQFPVGPVITVQMVEEAAEKGRAPRFEPPDTAFDPTAVVVYGGGGHGKSVVDLLRALHVYRVVGIVDDGLPAGTAILGLPVLGGAEVLADLHAQGTRLAVNAVGGIGNVGVRVRVFARLSGAGFGFPAVVHPTALVEPSAVLAPGGQVFPLAYIGSEVQVGFGAIVNTGAVVSHECWVGAYANVSPGALLAGGVRVGAGALVGMGVTVNLGVQIGEGARIGNGATVKADVPAGGVVRAGSVWPG